MHIREAHETLRTLGFHPQFIAEGMESFVFAVRDSRLAKVWIAKQAIEVRQLQSFYAQLRQVKLPFLTPLISEVLEAPGGLAVSIEERLPGVPLRDVLEVQRNSAVVTNKGLAVVAEVVEALSAVRGISSARELNVLGEGVLWAGNRSWGEVLTDLINRRVNRYKHILARHVIDLEAKVDVVRSRLGLLDTRQIGIIHGDICTPNVLVDENTFTPTALIDFGFLTTAADPLFDAVISALIFDMYSPTAHVTRRALYETYAQKWGEQFVNLYPLYKTSYALITSNAYSEKGEDGHFKWCVDILNDTETKSLIN